MKLLIFPPIDDARFQRICEIAPGLQVVRAASPADALREIADADAFYGKITPELLAAAGQIRWIQSPTASLEHYLFPELIAHPVTVTNMRGLFSDVIADHVMGYIIMFARNLHRYRDQQLRHEWSPVGDPQAKTDFVSAPGVVTAVDHAHIHLADTSLGIIGMGAIGREVARRASGFGMTIRGVDPQPDPLPGIVDEIWPAERIPELLRESRFVVIAAPHTPATEQLFDQTLLEQMRSDAYLINIGRGAIVNLQALTTCLQSGRLAGAALDVFETEPLPQDHPLWSLENAILTPHIAAASPRVPERHLATLLENIHRFSTNQPLLNVVNKEIWC